MSLGLTELRRREILNRNFFITRLEKLNFSFVGVIDLEKEFHFLIERKKSAISSKISKTRNHFHYIDKTKKNLFF